MSRQIIPLIVTIISFGIISCGSTKSIVGKYGTNFAEGGFFGTKVTLKEDSTLEYIFSGNMIYHHVTGHYRVSGHKVYMKFGKEIIDTNFSPGPLFDDSIHQTIHSGDTISFQRFFLIGYKKIFFAHAQTGKKITKTIRYCKRRKYLLFGGHYYKRRWYLKKRGK